MGNISHYAVLRGRKPGIYNTWEECEQQVKGFSRAKFKKFSKLSDAKRFLSDSSSHALATRYRTVLPSVDLDTSSDDKRTSKQIKPTIIYTDGCALGNGPRCRRAGIGVFFGDNDPRNLSEPLTSGRMTNQRAELQAAIRALQIVPETSDVEIKTDSIYVVKIINDWSKTWESKGWNNVDLKNKTLIMELCGLCKYRRKGKTTFVHVSGHSGIYGNDMADKLAKDGAKMLETENPH